MMTLTGKLPPIARREAIVEGIAGVVVEDPYRWLEVNTEETLAWQDRQNDFARSVLHSWPGLDQLALSLQRHMAPMPALPRRGGGLWFRIDPDARAPSLIVGASSMGSGLTLRAGAREAEDREAPCFEFFSPSPDGKYVAYGAPEGGGLQGGVQLQRLRVMEVESGHDLSFRIDHASCSLVWSRYEDSDLPLGCSCQVLGVG
jgi:prolyl oligopeptidase